MAMLIYLNLDKTQDKTTEECINIFTVRQLLIYKELIKSMDNKWSNHRI
jgi:hypothetical protein